MHMHSSYAKLLVPELLIPVSIDECTNSTRKLTRQVDMASVPAVGHLPPAATESASHEKVRQGSTVVGIESGVLFTSKPSTASFPAVPASVHQDPTLVAVVCIVPVLVPVCGGSAKRASKSANAPVIVFS